MTTSLSAGRDPRPRCRTSTGQPGTRLGAAVAALIVSAVTVYQQAWSIRHPGMCRHFPSCSTYLVGAVTRFGAGRGLALGAARLLRCGPWGTSGYDPVPERACAGPSAQTEACSVVAVS